MARRYARDNRGRFASTGSGATARGGRLKTAAGNKRATQTITAGSRVGTIKKPAGLKPATIKPQSSIGSVGARLAARDKATPAPAAKAVRKVPTQTDFATMKRRYDRTKPTSGGLTNDISDRRGGYGPAAKTKLLNSMSTRKRALGLYKSQAIRPLNELSTAVVRAPVGRFSTVKNPAPAKAFPSQAPGRTKKAELLARENRINAKAARRRR